MIRRLVRGLSYPGSVVLDFFAGSGTTGRVCIEEGRHSILVDNDINTMNFFKKHLNKMTSDDIVKNYEISENPDLADFFNKVKNASIVN